MRPKKKFELVLSVSCMPVTSKQEGQFVKNYAMRKFPLENNEWKSERQLREVLRHYNHTVNVYDGQRCAKNVSMITGIMLDFDNTLSFKQAQKSFSKWKNVIYTTTSHTKEKPHVRVILPFAAPYKVQDDTYAFAHYLRHLTEPKAFTMADRSSFDAGRHFFPNCNIKSLESSINYDGAYYPTPKKSDLPKFDEEQQNNEERREQNQFLEADLKELKQMMNQKYYKGQRNSAIFALALKMKKCLWNVSKAANHIIKYKERLFEGDILDGEIHITVRSAYNDEYKLGKTNDILSKVIVASTDKGASSKIRGRIGLQERKPK